MAEPIPPPPIPDDAIRAYRRASEDAEEQATIITGGDATTTIDVVWVGIEAGLAAAWPLLAEQWRCTDPDLRTACTRCPDRPPLADHEMLPHARAVHPEVLTAPGSYRSTLCTWGLCAVFPGRCRLVEKWSRAPCDHACHKPAESHAKDSAAAETQPSTPDAPWARSGHPGPPHDPTPPVDDPLAHALDGNFNLTRQALTQLPEPQLANLTAAAANLVDIARDIDRQRRIAAVSLFNETIKAAFGAPEDPTP
jgi:hypothetical protein